MQEKCKKEKCDVVRGYGRKARLARQSKGKQGAACPRLGSKLAEKEKKRGVRGERGQLSYRKGECVTLASWDKAMPKKGDKVTGLSSG